MFWGWVACDRSRSYLSVLVQNKTIGDVLSIHDLTLKHYGREPDIGFNRMEQYGPSTRHDKPSGFWVSVQGECDWKQWCEDEHFATETLANEHDVILSSGANILYLDSLDAIHKFSDEWGAESSRSRFGIHWDLVTDHYDGIIIAPYQWAARFSERSPWYYSWDVASGCIWNLDAVERVAPTFRSSVGGCDE